MNIHKVLRSFIGLFLMLLISSCGAPAAQPPAGHASIISPSVADTIAKFQLAIPQQMQKENTPGLAIAVVDDQSILWQESFGYTDWDRQTPVTPSTLFSIQSMSKSFTATAAMFAAQDSLVDLDEPITTYLPDFHVNSIFEEHPEQKITLRILLSHTAGFAHEAPYGGNYDHPAYSFEKHIASISDTWLKFPVGTRYSYSNLGIDLAGYILQVRSSMPFIEYVQKKVLDPLGMRDSTLDINRLRANPARAIGHVGVPLPPPVDFLLIPSGGVWTNTTDMACYLQFHINKGVINGSRLLQEGLAETMYTPPNMPANAYALGIVVTFRHGVRRLEHGGGGFGFNSEMIWYPELKLGVVVLSNAHSQEAFVTRVGEDVLDSIIEKNEGLYAQRIVEAKHIDPAYPPSRSGAVLTDAGLQALIESKSLPDDEAASKRRSAYSGKYIASFSGFPTETVAVSDPNSKLVISFLGETHTLTEVEPGLFFSSMGDAFDLRGPDPMLMNIHLVKADTSLLPFKIAFYAICGLMFLSGLLFWPVRALVLKIRQKNAPADNTPRSTWLVWARRLSTPALFFSLFCLAFVALIPNQVYLGWPSPYTDLFWWQIALLELPFASLLLAAGIFIFSVLSTKSSDGARAMRWYSIALSLALLAFNLIILL